MNDDVVKKLEYWAFKLCGKGEQEDAASDVMSEALKEIIKLRDETERLTRERDEALAEVEKLRADNEKLRSALKPFAVEAEAYDPPEKDDEDDAETAWFSFFTCGNLRDARRALEQAASDDKIKNIKNPLLTDPDAWFVDKSDRSFLLAEVEKLTRELDEARAEVEKLRAALRDIERGDYSDPMCERTPEQRAREALGVKP